MKFLILVSLGISFFCLAHEEPKAVIKVNHLKEELNFKKKATMVAHMVNNICILMALFCSYQLLFNDEISEYEDLQYSRIGFCSMAVALGAGLYEIYLNKKNDSF